MNGFPCHFNDTRLLSEVINSKFAFRKDTDASKLHTSSRCRDLSPGPTFTVIRDLGDINPSHLCSRCVNGPESLVNSWQQSIGLNGPAHYSVSLGPFAKEDGKPRDLARLIVERISTEFQVMTLPRESDLTWVISVIPGSLVPWLDSGLAYPDGTPRFATAGPVHPTDSPITVECAIRLWENSSIGPLSLLGPSLEAARTVVG